MIQYLLKLKCENESCWNLNTATSAGWGPLQQANHPCGVCGHLISSELVDQREVPDPPVISLPAEQGITIVE